MRVAVLGKNYEGEASEVIFFEDELHPSQMLLRVREKNYELAFDRVVSSRPQYEGIAEQLRVEFGLDQ